MGLAGVAIVLGEGHWVCEGWLSGLGFEPRTSNSSLNSFNFHLLPFSLQYYNICFISTSGDR